MRQETTTPNARLGAPLTTAEGFVAFYRREAELVLGFCTRRVLEAETGVDLCAETFAQAFRGRSGFRGSTELEARAWLLTIARRQVGHYFKEGALDRRAREALGMQTPQLQDGEAEEIERRAGLAPLRAALADELEQLGGDQREALRLRVVEEQPYPEVARALGVSEATARARVSRGLRTLAARPALRALTESERP
jgi:RNA polymerase sigma factor (sigma-70 family)